MVLSIRNKRTRMAPPYHEKMDQLEENQEAYEKDEEDLDGEEEENEESITLALLAVFSWLRFQPCVDQTLAVQEPVEV
ncbi:hypothetical protein NDU88_003941 [Pleurodeles waltl]|uniref:Uncharacterized protein n=1 Tax=Pleurodeles waltl TaxID=8319 RepID=A0AAV7REC7_PLEWA|nr:hypothetical protein NDU88_003941 [Pleurodeles waltl]